MDALPERFLTVVVEYYGSVGRRWLTRLDDIIPAYCDRWGLTLTTEPPMMGSRSLIIPCREHKHGNVVLKLCPDPYLLGRERDGLRHWEGCGHTVRVLRGSGARGAMLLKKLDGGSPTHLDATLIEELVEVISCIHGVPDPLPALDCEQHIASLLGHCIGRLSHPQVAKHVNTEDFKCAIDRALTLAISRDVSADVLLHGDIQLPNLVRNRKGKLIAIDPKPFLGEPELELALLVRDSGPASELETRIREVSHAFAANEERVYAWTKVLILDTAISHARWGKTSEESVAQMMEFCRAD